MNIKLVSVLLFAGCYFCEPRAGLCAAAGQQPALAVMGFRRGRRRGLRRDAADHGGISRNDDGHVCPADAVRKLDMTAKTRSARVCARAERTVASKVISRRSWCPC